MLALTHVDKALLIAEWGDMRGVCPCCKHLLVDGHAANCEMDLGLAERGFPDQHARDTARASLT
jgi:hypothetical protein